MKFNSFADDVAHAILKVINGEAHKVSGYMGDLHVVAVEDGYIKISKVSAEKLAKAVINKA